MFEKCCSQLKQMLGLLEDSYEQIVTLRKKLESLNNEVKELNERFKNHGTTESN